MASISHLSLIHQSRFSAFYKQHSRTSAKPILHRNLHTTTASNHLEFSSLHKKIAASESVKFSGKSLRNEVSKPRLPSEFCCAKAAAADAEGHEIELTNGFEQIPTYCKCEFVRPCDVSASSPSLLFLAGLLSLRRVLLRDSQLLLLVSFSLLGNDASFLDMDWWSRKVLEFEHFLMQVFSECYLQHTQQEGLQLFPISIVSLEWNLVQISAFNLFWFTRFVSHLEQFCVSYSSSGRSGVLPHQLGSWSTKTRRKFLIFLEIFCHMHW